MTDQPPPRPIVILGPTAGGKSELAVSLARRLREVGQAGEVIGADSMQVYIGMDAGTAKPTPEQRSLVPHHLIDIVRTDQRFTVADWLERAERLIAGMIEGGVTPIVVGGTNLYLKALLEGLFEGPPADEALRGRLESMGSEALHQRLRSVDPIAADRVHRNDRKKMIRALEVHELTGRPISEWQSQWSDSPGSAAGPVPRPYRHDPVLLGLDWPTELIHRRINARVKGMFDPAISGAGGAGAARVESLPEEVARLVGEGRLGTEATARAGEALGYKQTLEALRGGMTLEEAREQTKVQTRRYAKQQRSWLRRYRGVCWLAAGELSAGELAERAWEWVVRSRAWA